MTDISPHQLNELIFQKKVIVIDVREPFEHKACHIKDSILIPFSDFDITKIPPANDKNIVFHCKSGRRSQAILGK